MNIKTVLFVCLLIALVLYLFCPSVYNTENFTEEEYIKLTAEEENKKKKNNNPKKYQSMLNELIEDSPFVGLPNELNAPWEGGIKGYGKIDDDWMENLNGDESLSFNMCSKSCCSPQYPTPFALPEDPLVCNSKDEFVPSSYTCNNGWQDSGCVCMTKKQSKFLGSRGGNA